MMSTRVANGVIAALTILICMLLFVWTSGRAEEIDMSDDLVALSSMSGSFSELGTYFVDIAQKKGGVYAFSLLIHAPLRGNIDTHLLGHLVGDELYKQEGIDGMQFCTDELRNACSHSVVIGALLEMGDGVFDKVNDVCKKAPGGRGAYTMCFHGFGHGVLAYNEYEMPDTVEMCKRVGTEEYHNREYIECVGGAVMELVGGVHDVELRMEKSKKYLSADDPLMVCGSDFLDPEARPICYTYITPMLFTASGAGLGLSNLERLPLAFAYCDGIDVEDTANRSACYGGFGKEFVVLVRDRDVRDIEMITDAQLSTIDTWCRMAGDEHGEAACMSSALSSLYWGGENSVEVPLRFCRLIAEDERRAPCMGELIDAVSFYAPDDAYKKDFCTRIPEEYQDACNEALL